MCGIAGIVYVDGRPVDPMLLRRMTEVLTHRGPDDGGYLIEDGIGLGHRRLSIIDLSSAGHQPMSNEDGSVWITYNGEVYTYPELTAELKAKGHVFRSRTDTEAVLHAYEEYGVDCLSKFNGMFAFAIWDRRRRRLFCARDRFGIKPFHYFWDGHSFRFASEIKAVLQDKEIERSPNDRQILEFLAVEGLNRSEETFFKGIYTLPPAHYLTLRNGRMQIRRYWEIQPDHPDDFAADEREDRLWAEAFRHLFEDAVRLRLRSDVPVGTCLSGGLDSSSIVCVANRLLSGDGRQKTFSACFEDPAYDERPFAQEVLRCTGAEGHVVFPGGEDFLEEMRRLIWHQEEPLGGASVYAQWHVMRLAREGEVKVLLDGQGADEILAGYEEYHSSYFLDLACRFEVGRLIEEVGARWNSRTSPGLKTARNTLFFALPEDFQNGIFASMERKWLGPFSEGIRLELDGPLPSRRDHLTGHLLRLLTVSRLPSLLHFEDRNSMAFSIEARVPFLDHRLVEFSFSLPAAQKIRGGLRKVVLRNAMKGILPEKVRTRIDKMTFQAPQGKWLRAEAREEAAEILYSRSFRERGYFNVPRIKKDFEAHCAGRQEVGKQICRWIDLELWLRTFIDGSSELGILKNEMKTAEAQRTRRIKCPKSKIKTQRLM